MSRLVACGIQPTIQRLRVAGELLGRAQHLTAEQLLAALGAAGARVSKATIYNTLNLFAERGLVRQLTVDGACAWFDSNVHPHYHFHDLDSGELIDFPISDVEFRRLPPPPPGMEVERVDLVVRVRKRRDL